MQQYAIMRVDINPPRRTNARFIHEFTFLQGCEVPLSCRQKHSTKHISDKQEESLQATPEKVERLKEEQRLEDDDPIDPSTR